MAYSATVLRVMIASPSDVAEARDEVERAIHSWNDANAKTKGIVLQPWRWETSSVPIMGEHPQRLINAQGVDDADIVFALFGGRLGSPTLEVVSGTAEEIDRALELGKHVHTYFSSGPLPHDLDTAQLDALRAFKSEMEQRGLLGEFSNVSQLGHEVWKAIEYDIAHLDSLNVPATSTTIGVDFRVQPRQEREVSGVNAKGAPRYTTRHWVEVTNDGGRDAEKVTLEVVGDGVFLSGGEDPTVIHRGQTRTFNVMYTMQGTQQPVLRIRWTEDEEQKSKDFHIG